MFPDESSDEDQFTDSMEHQELADRHNPMIYAETEARYNQRSKQTHDAILSLSWA